MTPGAASSLAIAAANFSSENPIATSGMTSHVEVSIARSIDASNFNGLWKSICF
ncbi:hypothetical protein [Bradyrhizobium viridifuturi]|uniref:hypothetical protein n=1 Tax=Bradyrhizobium viridifuturi TaxID=1654716 RepID=UPI0012FF4491|nr:hypothetical protein [Bradyrhizobium viridifuturi]